MSATVQTVALPIASASNVFMTLARYGRLKNLATAPRYLPVKLDCPWAALCLPGAVRVVRRGA